MQRQRFLAKLRQAMRSLLDHPNLGQPRDDLYPGCRRLLIEHHVAYYRIEGDELIICRVLSASQEPTGKVTL
ncbi:MAG: type II toxin-antitoxin system RelE/ParE family toxin [Thermomicrobiales bacterium]|nr:type II toxin-antitoxin system RelE/ParE family toxin [Thermomicrobiales bacterium]